MITRSKKFVPFERRPPDQFPVDFIELVVARFVDGGIGLTEGVQFTCSEKELFGNMKNRIFEKCQFSYSSPIFTSVNCLKINKN